MAKKTSPVGEAVKKAVGKKDSKSHAADMSREMKIKSALYEIADAASAVTDMQEFYAAMHRIVGRLMYAKSFYVTLYDATTGILSSPYFADESGDTPPPPTKIDKSNKSLRGYVLLKGRTLHICAAEIEEGKRRGKFKPMGTMAEDWVGVPLRMEGQTIGSLTVQSYQKGIRYTAQDVKLLEFVAQHIAVALTRARAIEETRQRNSELQIVNSVQEGLASKLDMQAMYELVGDKIRRIFDADVVGIVFYDRELGMMNYPYLIDHGERYFPEPAPISDKHMNYVKATGAVLIHTYEQASQLMSKWGIKNVGGPMPDNSYIAVPLFISNQIMGRITVAKLPSHAFNESDVRLLQTLANSMSVALENARLFDETQRLFRAEQQAHQQAEILRSIAQALNHSLSLTDVFDLVLTEIQNVIPYDSAGIYQVHENRREFVTGRGFTNLDDLMGVSFEFNQRDDEIGYLISQSLQPLILGDALVEYPQYFNTGLHAATKIRSYIAVPIVLNQKLIGMITLDKLEPNFYTEQHAKLAMAFAAQAATAINNARLFDETQRLLKETEQGNAELAIINSVQAALAAQLDIHGIYDAVGEKLREIFSYQDVTIYTADLRSRIVNVEYSYALGQKGEQRIVPMNSLYEYFATSHKTFVFNGDLPSFIAKFSDYQNPEPPKSLLAVPIPRNKDTEPVAFLTIQDWDGTKVFSDSDMRLLQTLANSISVAIENARLFDETQRLLKETEDRAAELAIINRVQEGLATKLEIQAIYELVGDKIREIFDANTVVLATFDFEKGLMHRRYTIERGMRYYFDPTPIPRIWVEFIQQGQPALINENLLEFMQRIDPDFDVPAGEMPKSALSVPLRLQGEIRGVISLQNVEREHAFSESDMHLLQTFANSMSVALENARLFDETQQRNAELAIINSVQEGLASKLDMQAIYDLVGEKIRETFNAQVVSIVTYDRAEQLMHSRYYYEDGRALPGITLPSFGFRKYVLENCRPLLINEDMPRWIKEYNNPVMRGTEPKSAIFIPMIVGEEATGVISLQNNDRELAFTEADVRLLTTLANSMSVALENARLWEQEKMYRKALERELEIGREIQAGFLPDELPLIEGWEIGASLMSAREVAGDFYDAFELPDGNIGLVIADVCDKGVGAALFMTLFRSLIRVTANQEMFEHAGHDRFSNSVAQRLQHAMRLTNNYIAETHEASGMFATLFFGILDPRDGSLTYINGGHEPPLILEAGGVCESLRKTGPAVGAIPDCSFDTLETRLNPGAMFFAFTDGVPEAKDPIGDFFGRERLLNILRADSGSAHELLKTVESELHHYMNGATQFDDITLLAVRRVR